VLPETIGIIKHIPTKRENEKMKEYYITWIQDGKDTPRFTQTQKQALEVGTKSGYEFSIEFVNDYSLKSN